MIGHAINVAVRFRRVVRQFPATITGGAVLVHVKRTQIVHEDGVQPVGAHPPEDAEEIGILGTGGLRQRDLAMDAVTRLTESKLRPGCRT